jgi:HrpA-like RNA helicase
MSPAQVIVMSATLDTELFCKYFGAHVVNIPGRQFPVEVRADVVSWCVHGRV